MASLKVAVRVRPFNQREHDMDAKAIVQMDGKKTRLQKIRPPSASIRIENSTGTVRDQFHDFTFDYSYWSFDDNDKQFTTQDQVYEDLGTDVINCAFQGYNACVFAYGQTGSGKTFTMMGTSDELGLIPRICKSMFNRMKLGQESGVGYKTQVSYLEIYNERVRDLLGAQNLGHGLRVREHRTLGPYVEDLSQHPVCNYEEIQECINQGNILRTTASTNMNDTSSRSHAIFTITFVQAGFMENMPSETVSKIHLVDLAGSERANATGATGQRLKEGAHINKSLVTLGSVISALAEHSTTTTAPTGSNKRILYIPYRDSVLTWLLKDSLGGNSKTIMIAAISPADCNYSETLSTLRYANRAKNIINKPTINEDPNVKLIRELRDEIMKLKSMLMGSPVEMGMSKMLEDLMKKEAQEKVLTEEWTEKWREAQMILREQKSLGLRKSGVGVVLDSEQPHLIGIHDDVSTGVTLYSLKDGETTIGTDDADTERDIVLDGIEILSEHCSISLVDGIATIYPQPGAQCWLNASLINDPTRISQGDILLLGRTNMFRYNNPTEAAIMRKDASRSRLDLSRLSIIAASRENLNSSIYCCSDDEIIFTSPMRRDHRQYYPSEPISRDDPDLQHEHRKILETIENALKQLNIERVNMYEQYKTKVDKLAWELDNLIKSQSNSLAIFECRERELFARREMLNWEKNNSKTQIDIIMRQISALQTRLDSKKRDFYEYAAKELQELQDFGKLDEIDIKLPETDTDDLSEVLLQVSKHLENFASQFIRDTIQKARGDIQVFELDLLDKEKLLNDCSEKLAMLDEKLLGVDDEQKSLKTEKIEFDASVIKLKKESLKLNIIRSTTESDAQTDTNDLNASTQLLDTCDDTFHTATSDCSTQYSTPMCASSSIISVIDASRTQLTSSVMSDSGVSFGATSKINPSPTAQNDLLIENVSAGDADIMTDDDHTSCSSSCPDDGDSSADIHLTQSLCAMHELRQRIAEQKAQIMKILETDQCDKCTLNDRIAELQEMKKDYFKLEKELQDNGFTLTDRHNSLDGYCASDSEICRSPGSNGSVIRTTIDSRREDISQYSPSINRSLPSIQNYPESEYCISIISYLIRGAGKQTHFEYEILISLTDDKWTLLRRFSRFRELHISMKNCYGDKISNLSFPRRELFARRSETVARNRRRQLETYLRRLLVVCSKIPQCPIYEGANGIGLSKNTLIEFSPFFKKGLFESGRHGTG